MAAGEGEQAEGMGCQPQSGSGLLWPGLAFGAFGSFGQDSNGIDRGWARTERRISSSPRKSGPIDTWVDAE